MSFRLHREERKESEEKMKKTAVSERTIQARLFAGFEKHRDNIAIECEDRRIDYDRLHRQSNYIANRISARGIGKNSFIGVMLDDKLSLVTVILAVIKAGCVFVPLDSNYPDKRTEAMLLSADVPYIFTEEDKVEKLKAIRRRLSQRIDIFTVNERFYLPGRAPEIKLYEDKYKLSEAEKTRYARQLLMDGWGIEGQERLKSAVVFVAGAGGSGSPLIQQLALCGFGTIIICDYDTVELSNLNRQSLHDETRIGMNKALSAKMTVERMNPHIKVIARQEKITRDNVFDLVGDAEIIFDNVDSLEAKSCLSECAVARGIPHTISSMIHINAYACVFHTPLTPCFHCLYDKAKIDDITRAKSLTGHYKVIPNSVASPALYLSTGFVVNEAVKILLGMGEPAYNKYIHFNQYGSPEVKETNGYNQITYPFSTFFRELSRKQGFDWDGGWHGHFVEEIKIESDPHCPFCSGTGSTVKGAAETGTQTAKMVEEVEEYYQSPPQVEYLPEDEINIYFTSGTTGQPKAVLGKNESLTHFIAWEVTEFGIDHTKRVSQLTSQCHDPFLRDIFVPLCAGSTLCVPESRETILDPVRMKNWLEKAGVNLVHCTPGIFKIINSEQLDAGSFPRLEYVLMAGERVVPRDLENWYRFMGGRVRLVNVYGPTETTLAKLFYLIEPEDVNRDNMPIGKPIPGARVIILDKEFNICGTGEVGEIFIRTPFRSYGYVNDPRLTAEKFIRNPFSDNPGDIVYRTGDLGKLNREGNVEFMGRRDRQVKIRGFRVELAEIEKRLRDYPGIREAVVLNRLTASGNSILCAYFRGDISVPEVKEFLNGELPDYMVPSFFIKLEQFPLNVNGKVNYKALPEPDDVERKDYTAPRNDLEREVITIWTEILGIEKIGIHDGFLDMGGNSLNAMNLTSRIYKAYNVNLQLSQIFENPTVAELAAIIEGSAKSIYQSIEPVEKRAYYPLSSSQMRMYLLREFAGEEDTSYNQPKPLILKGDVDIPRLEDAFRRLIARHDALRTGFETINGRPAQRIHEEVAFEISRLDVGAGVSVPEAVRNFIAPFDLSRPPLLRVGLVSISDEEYVLIFDIHHIISDGVTTGIFIDEFMKLYNNEVLPELRIQYKDYAVWQQKMLASVALKKQESYWLEVFKEHPPLLNLTTDFPRPPVQTFAGSHLDIDVPSPLVRRLEVLARERNATLYMVLLAGYTALLYRFTGQEDIVVGSPIAGRQHAELQNIPGVFINTLAMRNFPNGSKTFDQLVKETAENAFKAYENQDYPFEELVGKLDLKRNLERNPLFETLFIMQNIDQKPIVLQGLEIRPYPLDVPTSKFDISLNALETTQGLVFNIEYCTRLFRSETIERFGRHFVTLLERMVNDPLKPIGRIDILSFEEKEQLLRRFNDTRGDFPGDKTIQQLFEESVARFPDSIAVTSSHKSDKTQKTYITYLSYKQLNESADRLAAHLIGKGLAPGGIAGVMVKRSFEMIVAIMGILKAGAAYLPIDPEYPRDRIQYMLDDSAAKILIDAGTFSEVGVQHAVKPPASPEDLAYVIYTSGSTGKPKGVAISQRNVMNFFAAMKAKIEFSPGNAILALTTVSFDIFLLETLLPLTAGMRVVVANGEQQKDPELLRDLMSANRIDMLQVTPSRLKLFLREQRYEECLWGLSSLIIGGEALPPDLYQRVMACREQVSRQREPFKVYNVYGPTETTVWSTFKDLSAGEETVTIGKPLLNTSIYIVDKDGNLLPRGIAGELYIGGEGAAHGYLNRPELTAEKFINKSFPGVQGAVFQKSPLAAGGNIYRTGDLARWLPDGDLEFLGRVDYQVKIRGFRIETGEIETLLSVHEHIKEAVVCARERDGENYLCAYIVPSGTFDETAESSVAVSQLRDYLSQRLPGYMIPSYFIFLEAVPLTLNGKIDRRALPPLELHTGDGTYTAPGNPLEEKLAEIWSQVLNGGSVPIGIDADYFELGGNSLSAALLLSEIHRVFQVRVSMLDLFKAPTVRGTARYIAAAGKTRFTIIEPMEKREFYPLTPAQNRLHLLQQMDENSVSYNIPSVVELDGPIDTRALEKTFERLILRHDALRTSFTLLDGEPVQRIHDSVSFKIDYSEVAPSHIDAEVKAFVRPFDLSAAPLLRVGLLKHSAQRHLLIVDIHHIISDGISFIILMREFGVLYGGGSLPAPHLQYKDYTCWLNQKTQQEMVERRKSYWMEQFAGDIPVLRLPIDNPRSTVRSSSGSVITFEITGTETRRLKELAVDRETTLYMVLLTMYYILLSRLGSQEDIVVGTVAAGRGHSDLQSVVGMFVNTLALRNFPGGDKTFSAFLDEVTFRTLEAFENQDYPFERLAAEVGVQREPGRNPLFDVMFELQNAVVSDIQMAGVTLKPFERETTAVKFDLTLMAMETGEELSCRFLYNTSLFKEDTIRRFIRYFRAVIAGVLEDPRRKLADIDILSEKNREQVLALVSGDLEEELE